jgi:hypothetical protein
LKESHKKKPIVWIIGIITVLWFPYDSFVSAVYVGFIRPYIKKQVSPLYVVTPAEQLGIWLKHNTTREDYVFIWTLRRSQILAYSERQSPSRYFNSAYVANENVKQELLNDLINKPPKFILIPTQNGTIPEMKKIIDEFYIYKESKAEFDIFERTRTSSN